MLKHVLADQGIKVQKVRLCDSIHRVDHEGVETGKGAVSVEGLIMFRVPITYGT